MCTTAGLWLSLELSARSTVAEVTTSYYEDRPIIYYTRFLFITIGSAYAPRPCKLDAREIRLTADVDITGDRVFIEQFLRRRISLSTVTCDRSITLNVATRFLSISCSI